MITPKRPNFLARGYLKNQYRARFARAREARLKKKLRSNATRTSVGKNSHPKNGGNLAPSSIFTTKREFQWFLTVISEKY